MPGERVRACVWRETADHPVCQSPDVNPEQLSVFPQTRWTVVLQLRSASDAQRGRAFEELCRDYWKPLYSLARRSGFGAEDAEDLTQGFLLQLLRREDLGPLTPEKGRLRTFLKTAFRNFIVDASRRELRAKRGGGVEMLSLDMASSERQYQRVPAPEDSPEEAFDRHWAYTILRRSLEILRARMAARGRADVCRQLEVFLGLDGEAAAYAEIAGRLGQTENTVAASVRRLRQEFRDLLRQEVADTLVKPEDVDAELQYLLRVVDAAGGPPEA